MLQTTIYRKQTDRQNYLDTRSEHPKLVKDRIPYSQALRIKRIYSSQQLLSHTMKMINQFQKRGYKKSLIEKQTFERKKERYCYNHPFITQI